MTGLPSRGNHGGALTCFAIIKQLIKEGHRVSVISLFDLSKRNPYTSYKEINKEAVEELGAEVKLLEYDLRDVPLQEPYRVLEEQRFLQRLCTRYHRLRDPDIRYFYHPFPHFRNALDRLLRETGPDVCFAYHYEPLAALDGLSRPPTMAGFGDLTHLPGYFRWWKESPPPFGLAYFRSVVWNWEERLIHTRLMRRLLLGCEKRGAFAGHYSRWLVQHGISDCQYLRTPVADPVGPDWLSRRQQEENAKRKILVVGDLHGTVSRAGLRLTGREVLPALEEAMGTGAFEMHFVGRGEVPDDVTHLYQRPTVVMRGVVDPADREFLSAHVLFVPTPITLGIRVRIVTGLAFGCCVVTHLANQQGIPELEDGVNCLLSSSGRGLARKLENALRDNELRLRIQRNARNTYEKYFSEDVAAGHIVNELVGLTTIC